MFSDSKSRHVVLSGCSGGGKSTLLATLGARGFATVAEPGRAIVEAELGGEGRTLPWLNMAAFARRALDLAAADRDRMRTASGWIFFDRGLVDAAVALAHAQDVPIKEGLAVSPGYHTSVFLTPPWPEIYRTDTARQHGLEDAVAEYDRLLEAYDTLGYEAVILPKCDVQARADYVLAKLMQG